MDWSLYNVRITVQALSKCVCSVYGNAHDVIAFGHAGNINPLTGELLVIPVSPSGSYALEGTTVSIALTAIVFKRVFKAEALLVSGHH